MRIEFYESKHSPFSWDIQEDGISLLENPTVSESTAGYFVNPEFLLVPLPPLPMTQKSAVQWLRACHLLPKFFIPFIPFSAEKFFAYVDSHHASYPKSLGLTLRSPKIYDAECLDYLKQKRQILSANRPPLPRPVMTFTVEDDDKVLQIDLTPLNPHA